MATPKPNQKYIYGQLAQRVEGYVELVDSLYDGLQKDAIRLSNGLKYDGLIPFTFDDYPTAKIRFKALQNKFVSELYTTIGTGTTDLWNRSNDNQNDFVDKVLNYYDASPKDTRFASKYFDNHDVALKSFQSRKIDGTFDLSDKVWNCANTAKADIEDALSLGLSEGKSASELSRDIRDYLNEPTRLYRRVRTKFGDLKPSKSAMKYRPGGGIYRSSYKNAVRLTRTEIAMSYREAEYNRWQDLDFILGYEVKRSHKMFPCVMCDSLAGKYPKDFKFTGWHPQCMCYTVPILMNYEDFWKTADGKSLDSDKYVTDMPGNFTSFVGDNYSKGDSLPYFMTENKIK